MSNRQQGFETHNKYGVHQSGVLFGIYLPSTKSQLCYPIERRAPNSLQAIIQANNNNTIIPPSSRCFIKKLSARACSPCLACTVSDPSNMFVERDGTAPSPRPWKDLRACQGKKHAIGSWQDTWQEHEISNKRAAKVGQQLWVVF